MLGFNLIAAKPIFLDLIKGANDMSTTFSPNDCSSLLALISKLVPCRVCACSVVTVVNNELLLVPEPVFPLPNVFNSCVTVETTFAAPVSSHAPHCVPQAFDIFSHAS